LSKTSKILKVTGRVNRKTKFSKEFFKTPGLIGKILAKTRENKIFVKNAYFTVFLILVRRSGVPNLILGDLFFKIAFREGQVRSPDSSGCGVGSRCGFEAASALTPVIIFSLRPCNCDGDIVSLISVR
jgi:hypothetical protein